MKKLLYNKAFLSMCAFLTVCLFILFYGFCSLADGNVNLVNTYNISSDYLLNYDSYDCFLEVSGDTNLKNSFDLNYSNGFEIPDTYYNSYYTNYVITCNTNNYALYFNAYSPSSIIFFDGNQTVLYCLLSECEFVQDNLGGRSFGATFYNEGSVNADTNWYINNNNLGNEFTIDGLSYCRRGISVPILSTNIPIYYCSDSLNVSSTEGLTQINPSYGSSQGESSDNNLVMDSPNFYFTNTNYTAPYDSTINTFEVYPNGYVDYTFDLNDYQLAHPEEFSLHIDYTFKLNFKYENTNQAFGPFLSTGSGVKKLFFANFTYNTEIDLDDYLEVGSKKSFQTIFAGLTTPNNYTLTGLLTEMKELGSIEYSNFELYCTAYLSNNTAKSGNYTEWYNPMKKTGNTTDVGATRNNNPYTGDDSALNTDYTPIAGAPGSAGNEGDFSLSDPSGMYNPYGNTNVTNVGGSDNYNYGGSPSVNVNTGGVVVNTGNDGRAVVDYTTGQLLPSGDANLGFVDDLEEVTESSKFVKLLSETFTFVPTTVWDDLGFFVKICLGILVGFFVLRLILDIL